MSVICAQDGHQRLRKYSQFGRWPTQHGVNDLLLPRWYCWISTGREDDGMLRMERLGLSWPTFRDPRTQHCIYFSQSNTEDTDQHVFIVPDV